AAKADGYGTRYSRARAGIAGSVKGGCDRGGEGVGGQKRRSGKEGQDKSVCGMWVLTDYFYSFFLTTLSADYVVNYNIDF
ncbi:hypothetical protein, partial [Xanthomonas perforans]|uniref:hypothetical protein n=1 Tax=Xanthomonas perforans TaxID=442694 RepID=UPI0019395957